MERLLAERLWGVPWIVLVLVALAVAAIYLAVDTSAGAIGWRWFILRWFHSLCWVLLSLAALAKTLLTPLPEAWSMPLAVAGGLVYAIFLGVGMLGNPGAPGGV